MHWLRPSEKVTVTNITTTAIFRIIHLIPEVQVLLHAIDIPPTLHWIRLHELPNLCQVLSRQLHVSGLQVFQSAFYVSAERARSTTTRKTRNGARVWVVYSRRSGKRDDVVAKSTNPSNAQLRDRDAFTIRYGRQRFHNLEVMTDILRSKKLSKSTWASGLKEKLASS
jgi:hypothetical protein